MEVGTVKQKILTWLPKFEIYLGGGYAGMIRREFTFFKPRYNIDFMGWRVEGNWLEWDYTILDAYGQTVAVITKDLWHWTDHYVLDIARPEDALPVLAFVLAIDAEKCSRS